MKKGPPDCRPPTPKAAVRAEGPLLAQLDEWLAQGRRYPLACLAALVLGTISYAALWDSHFYADDVDFFGTLTLSLQQDRFLPWLFGSWNGHLCLPTKLGYYVVWRWLGRSVVCWQFVSYLWWIAALVGLGDLYRRVFQSRSLGVLLSAIFACSTAYRDQLLIATCANHLWCASAAAWSLWAAWRFREDGRPRHLLLAVTLGILSFFCAASGLVAFLLMAAIALLWLNAIPGRRAAVLLAAGVLGAGGVVLFQTASGGVQSKLDVLFGLRETAGGLVELAGRLWGPADLSRVLAALGLACLALNWRRLSWRRIALGLLVAVLPLLLATSFRSDFPGIGAITRYAFLPLVGALFWVGEVWRLALCRQTPGWLTRRRGAVALAAAVLLMVVHSADKNFRSRPTAALELEQLEQEIGAAVAEFARRQGPAAPVAVPTRTIRLPVCPDQRPLDYLARYAVPVTLSRRVVGVPENPEFDSFLHTYRPHLCQALGVPEQPPAALSGRAMDDPRSPGPHTARSNSIAAGGTRR